MTLADRVDAAARNSDCVGVNGLADTILALSHHLELRGRAARDLAALTRTEITVMHEIHRQPGITATQIAATTGLQCSNVSAIALDLVSQGLLVRTTSGRGVGFTEMANDNLRKVHQHWVDRLRFVPDHLLAQLEETRNILDHVTQSITQNQSR
ncbi:MarR family transcriptional regulator [Amycolatopsis sp. TRM77291]